MCYTKEWEQVNVLTLKIIYRQTQESFDAVKWKVSIDDELDDLGDEYRSFRITKEFHCVDKMKIPEFWYKLRDVQDGLDQPKFQNLWQT